MESAGGMNYSGGQFQPVVDKCEGCERIVVKNETTYCKSYIKPGSRWRLGICNFATHAKPEIKVVKVRINPLKAAKRASSSRRG